MKLFDGTNLYGIIKSLSKAFDICPTQLIKEIKIYLLLNRTNLVSGNLSLQDFFKHCKKGNIPINTLKFEFDRVVFFHITSLIDNGIFLKEKGILDLDELLLNPSPLSEYLKRKSVEFFIKDNTPFIKVNGKIQKLNDLFCNKIKSVKPRINGRLTKPISMNLEGITGFLFLDHAKNDPIYQRIKMAPEFLRDLDDCIGGIADEWKKISRPVILKCEVDLKSWHHPDDRFEVENELEKSYKIAEEGFLCLAKIYGKQHSPNMGFRSNDYYPFIAHGIGVPPSRIIKFIEPS